MDSTSTAAIKRRSKVSVASLHVMGVICGLAAGVWLGAAEAPAKLVTIGISPFAISLYMVSGVFVARWTFPTLLKGTTYVFADLMARKHLIIWAVLAGALWAVANTLTVFAIRDVGLATAFPLWNTNALIGLLWGWLLFRELRGAGPRNTLKVIIGAIFIVAAAIMLGFSTMQGNHAEAPHALRGLLAAGGASLMWGTMYVPYRKAYLSGMNPLSFVTAFTFAELGTMLLLTITLDGGLHSSAFHLGKNKHILFWLFLSGFVWVVGDLFQQFATKYLGIGRGIPLSNTNQLWGLVWGALVFGELATATFAHRALVLGGSLLMVLGALAIATAVTSTGESNHRDEALERECTRYGLSYQQVLKSQSGDEGDQFGNHTERRRWWDIVILVAATSVFVWLGLNTIIPPLAMNLHWVAFLGAVLLIALLGGGWALWRQTRFS